MFNINFVRPHVLSPAGRRFLASAMLVAVAVQIMITLFLITRVVLAQQACNLSWALIQSKSGQAPMDEVVSKVRNIGEAALKKDGELRPWMDAKKRNGLIGPRLAAIVRTLPPRTWITEIASPSNSSSILIKASYLLDPKDPNEVSAQEWIVSLRGENLFAKGLRRLEIKNSVDVSQGKSQLNSFELSAEWERL